MYNINNVNTYKTKLKNRYYYYIGRALLNQNCLNFHIETGGEDHGGEGGAQGVTLLDQTSIC